MLMKDVLQIKEFYCVDKIVVTSKRIIFTFKRAEQKSAFKLASSLLPTFSKPPPGALATVKVGECRFIHFLIALLMVSIISLNFFKASPLRDPLSALHSWRSISMRLPSSLSRS